MSHGDSSFFILQKFKQSLIIEFYKNVKISDVKHFTKV